MSFLFANCCCGSTGDCFYGHAATGDTGDWGYCGHIFKDELYLRIPRPAFVTTSVALYTTDPSTVCPVDDFVITQTATGANDIIVRYNHYESTSRLYNWKYYQAYDTRPPCEGTCWGYDNPTGLNDFECCQDPTNASRCASASRLPWNGFTTFMSGAQQSIMLGLVLPRIASTTIACANKDFGQGYRHFDGIANHTHGRGELYNDNRYSPLFGWSNTPKKLGETMMMVLHRTKWWQRYFNSIHPNDCIPADCEEGTVASCRTPEYWDYECSGTPIFTWELYNIPSEFVTLEEKETIWTSYLNGDPLDQDVIDAVMEYLDKTPRDLGQADGRCIKTELIDTAGNTADKFSFARLGGWKYVCYTQDPDGQFPQWTTNYSNTCNFGGLDNCFTAAPIPQTTTCSSTGVCNKINACNGAPVGASILYTGCDTLQPVSCAQDTGVGDCSGIWLGFFQHCNTLPNVTWSSPYSCCIHNEAFLCVVPDGTSICDCSELPQEGLWAALSPIISSSVRNLSADINAICCSQKGMVTSTPVICDCVNSPNTRGCDGPEDGDYCVGITAGP